MWGVSVRVGHAIAWVGSVFNGWCTMTIQRSIGDPGANGCAIACQSGVDARFARLWRGLDGCGRGGTGRRAGFRFRWGDPCRFESCRLHHEAPVSGGEEPPARCIPARPRPGRGLPARLLRGPRSSANASSEPVLLASRARASPRGRPDVAAGTVIFDKLDVESRRHIEPNNDVSSDRMRFSK